MKIINPFKSHKKNDFVAYWDLKQFSQLLNKGIEVGSNYFFLIKNVGIFLFVSKLSNSSSVTHSETPLITSDLRLDIFLPRRAIN